MHTYLAQLTPKTEIIDRINIKNSFEMRRQ